MRLTTRSICLLSNYVAKVKSGQSRKFEKTLSQEYTTVLNQETLTGRILLYLNIDKEKQFNPTKNTTEMFNNVRQNTKCLRKLSTKEVVHFSTLLSQESIRRNELQSIMKDLDVECYLRLTDLKTDDILKLLNVYMSMVPNRITEFKFYNYAVKLLYESLNNLNRKDFLQLIFYIGLKKKSHESQSMLRGCMKVMDHNFINSLTSEELCIICNTTFKTSTKMNKSLLNKVRTYMNDNLFILKDSALFVTLIKTIRHNQYQDDNLLSTISCAVLFNKTIDFYSFPATCHIMAIFADYYYYEESLFKLFTEKCLEQLNECDFKSKKTHLTEQLRGKDIKRFLWVLSIFSDLKLVTHCDVKNVIFPKLMERIKAKEFQNDFDSLVEITLYLWMINHCPNELVSYVLSEKNAQLIERRSKTSWKLNLLLHTIHLEDSNLSNTLSFRGKVLPKNISDYQLHGRPHLKRLLNNLKVIQEKLDLDKFELSREIPHLNILGITGYKNRTNKMVYIELLDDYTRIRNIEEDTPVGLMALKLRLLDRCEEGLLVVSQKEIQDMTEAELSEYLLDEIKLIC